MNQKLLFALLTLSATQATHCAIQKITTMDEYKRVCSSQEPCVIVYNSATCTACDTHEKAIEPVAADYPKCKFYSVQTSDEPFTELDKQKLQIKAWPTTHFIKGGKVVRNERGSMSEAEFDKITYELVHGKPKPLPTVKPAAKS